MIAASKGFESKKICKLYQEGQRDFAENYVDELLQKQKELYDQDLNTDLIWHFIGQIQSQKVNKIVGQVDYIHSVDRLKILVKINQSAAQKGILQKVLLQVKFGQEEKKSGFSEAEIKKLFCSSNNKDLDFKNLKHVSLCGLMTLLPLNLSKDDQMNLFFRLHEIHKEIRLFLPHPLVFKELSMGMSDDYKWAIFAGSTMIRIGRKIFGNRK